MLAMECLQRITVLRSNDQKGFPGKRLAPIQSLGQRMRSDNRGRTKGCRFIILYANIC